MRTIGSLFIILALTGLAPGLAAAEEAKVAAATYPTCSCHFGYGNVCIAATSCDVNGGRCTGTCSLPPYVSLSNR